MLAVENNAKILTKLSLDSKKYTVFCICPKRFNNEKKFFEPVSFN